MIMDTMGNPSVNSRYPLKKSIMNGNFALTKVLINYGANVNYLAMEDLLYVVNDALSEIIQLLANNCIDFSLLNKCMPEYVDELLVQKIKLLSSKNVNFKNLYAMMLSRK